MIEKIYTKLQDDSSYTIYDPSSIKWGDFKWINGFTKHYITKEELLRPYLISYRYYNTVEYENFILLVNNIEDPFEVVSGTLLKIPTLTDVKQFILSNTK
jgi:hypothetical protein